MARKNPDDKGLMERLWFQDDSDPRWAAGKKGNFYEIRAYTSYANEFVGSAKFKLGRAYLYPYSDGVYVTPEFRRKGAASRLYREAEKRTGRSVRHSSDRTTDGRAFVKGRRKNPSLIVLSNPMDEAEAVPAPPAAWEKFHLRERDRARMTHIPSIAGVPERVTSLGLCEGVEMVDQHGTEEVVELDPTRNDGPWLVTDDETMSRLWIVSKTPISDLLAYEGYRSSAIRYYPPANSGKFDRLRGYRHEWGEGGRLAKKDWPAKAYPMLTQVDTRGRAFEFTDGAFTVRPEGIVG